MSKVRTRGTKATKVAKAAERAKGWNRADSCTADLTVLAKRFFGAAKVKGWMAQLEKHITSGANFTGYEAWLNDSFGSMNVNQKAAKFFEEIVARCLYTVAEIDDDGDGEEGSAPQWDERALEGFTFHNAKLVMRPNGYAKIKYMGEESEPEVLGMVGINCLIRADGEPYCKPTVLFVSKPFHQYRAMHAK